MDDKQNIHQDAEAAIYARFLLEDLNYPGGRDKLAEITGYSSGVITAAFDNIFPAQDAAQDATEARRRWILYERFGVLLRPRKSSGVVVKGS